MPEINGISVPFVPAGGTQELRRQPMPPTPADAPRTSFREVFEREVSKLRFSAHAQTRLNSRDIPMNDEDLQRLEAAVIKAEAKGARESLMVMGDTAFIVNIPNRTVITAVNSGQLKDNVFTNIDSAVIVR
jgi:flagellar operon protein